MIPKVIHQTWKTKVLDAKLQEWTSSWRRLNPSWKYQLWDDDDCEKFMQAHYPNLMSVYKALTPVQRADLFRYGVLYVHGGFYADIDAVCSAPLDSFIQEDDQLVVGVEGKPKTPNRGLVYPVQYCQWAMGARAKHPCMQRAVDVTVHNVQNYEKLKPVWYKTAPHSSELDDKNWETIMMTGPGAWTEAIVKCLEQGESIRVLDDCAFALTMSNSLRCPQKNIYVRHQFLGSWKGDIQLRWVYIMALLITVPLFTLAFILCTRQSV